MTAKFKKQDYPILEYDPAYKAIIEPGRNNRDFHLPERFVITFFADIVEKYAKENDVRIITKLKWETGIVTIYEMVHKGERIGFYHAWVGAPIAVGVMEFIIAYGAEKIIACGGCGVLDKTIDVGQILIPTSAIRDEGTSYHYLPPSREVEIDKKCVNILERVIKEHGYKYLKCKTWTTDAFYRETLDKVNMRKLEGCKSVEMECSALCALSKFRKVSFGQLLYGGDNLDLEAYDERDWQNNKSAREILFLLSLDSCIEL